MRPTGFALVIAGTAGSGKSTLGRAVAAALRVPMLDLDTLTNPLLDALPRPADGRHWLVSDAAAAIRSGRYAALRETASEVLETTGAVVLVAPFTAELSGGAEWAALRHALAPIEPVVVHLVGSPDLLAARRSVRGADRDAHRPAVDATPVVEIAVTSVAADLATEQQVDLVLEALGPGGASEG